MIPGKLQLTKLSFAIYFPAQDFGDKITLAGRLREAAEGRLDGEPMILPVPAGGPPDVPRIQLEAPDKSFVLQLSTVRMSLEWNKRTPQAMDWRVCSEDFERMLGGLLRVFVGEYARPTRFSFNPQFIFPLGRSANEYLATQFFQAGRVAETPFATKIGLMNQVQLDGRAVHLWMNVASARQQLKPEKDDVLVIQFDLRSARDVAGLGPDDILGVIEGSEELISDRLRAAFGDLFE